MPEYWKMHIQMNIHWNMKKEIDVAMQQIPNQRINTHNICKSFCCSNLKRLRKNDKILKCIKFWLNALYN